LCRTGDLSAAYREAERKLKLNYETSPSLLKVPVFEELEYGMTPTMKGRDAENMLHV
jgi:hypothetical protein